MAIDIEPGGRSQPVGYVGLVELDAAGLGSSFYVRFRSVDFREDWGQWSGAEAARADLWARTRDPLDEAEAHALLALATPGEIDAMRRIPEWARPEPATFVEVWPLVEAFIAGRPLIAYGARFDRSRLATLILRTGARADTALVFYDGLELVDQLLPRERDALADVLTAGGRTLEAAAVRLGLLTPQEIERRMLEHLWLGVGNKTVLHNATDDALACALLFKRAAAVRGYPFDVHEVARDYGLSPLPLSPGGVDEAVIPSHQLDPGVWRFQ